MLGTLARASDASAAERRALEAMARAPTAVWIDTKDKLRGADSLDTLEGTLANASGEARKREIKVALSNSFGFGGTNASLILGRMD